MCCIEFGKMASKQDEKCDGVEAKGESHDDRETIKEFGGQAWHIVRAFSSALLVLVVQDPLIG